MVATTHQRRGPGGRQRIDYSEAEQMLREGKTQQQVADKFGVRQAAVAEAIKRERIKFTYEDKTSDRAMPWRPIKAEHQHKYLARMLRAAHRRDQGHSNAAPLERMLDSFLRSMERDGFVVHYEPETHEGFFRVPRREGVDKGYVREPHLDDKGRVRKNVA